MGAPVIRPATAADIREFYERPPGKSLRAYVAELDGTLLGIGGLFYQEDGAVGCFSVMRPGMKPHRKTILRAARLLAEMAREAGAPAIADERHPNSRRLLSRLGFVSFGTTQYGELFGWRN